MRGCRAVIAAGLFAGIAASISAAAADDEAHRFTATIYAQYGAPETPGVVLDSRAALEKYFVPDLAEKIETDALAAERQDHPPALDGDPFVDAQEWDIKRVAIAVRHDTPEKATAIVSFFNRDDPRQVELALVKRAAGWRIDDIRWREGTLRGLYISKTRSGAGGTFSRLAVDPSGMPNYSFHQSAERRVRRPSSTASGRESCSRNTPSMVRRWLSSSFL